MTVRNETNFAIVPEWVLYADISPQAIRLYCVLNRHANKEGKATPSRRRLAKLLGVKDEKVVDRALSQLADLGAVEVHHRRNPDAPREFTSSEYVVRQTPPPGGRKAPTPGDSDAPTVGVETGEERKGYELEPFEPEKPLPTANGETANGQRTPTPQQRVWSIFEAEYGSSPPKGTRDAGKWAKAVQEALMWSRTDTPAEHRFSEREFGWRRQTYEAREWEDTGPLAVMSNWQTLANWPERRRRA